MSSTTTTSISASQHIRELRDELSAVLPDTDTLLSSVMGDRGSGPGTESEESSSPTVSPAVMHLLRMITDLVTPGRLIYKKYLSPLTCWGEKTPYCSFLK